MKNNGTSLVQAIEWKRNKYGVTSGTFENVNVLSCLDGGDVIAHFPEGDETVNFVIGADVTLDYIDITIVNGTFAIN